MTCDSCGVDAEQRSPVRRRYVTQGAWDRPATDRVLDEVERWCVACLTHYPHETVAAS